MSESQKIKEMIEKFDKYKFAASMDDLPDPVDGVIKLEGCYYMGTSADDYLDEIDARFWCYLHGRKFRRLANNHAYVEYAYKDEAGQDEMSCKYSKFSRSLDALKAVQDSELEGWYWNFGHNHTNNDYCMSQYGFGKAPVIVSDDLPTMCLAWMHALVQAIEWKRNN